MCVKEVFTVFLQKSSNRFIDNAHTPSKTNGKVPRMNLHTEVNSDIAALGQKYNLELPEGFLAEVTAYVARRHLESLNLHQELQSTPGMWRDPGTAAQSERAALEFIRAHNELQKLNQREPKPWWEKLKIPLGRKIP